MVNVVNIKSEREKVFFSVKLMWQELGLWMWVSGAEVSIPGGEFYYGGCAQDGYRSRTERHFESKEDWWEHLNHSMLFLMVASKRLETLQKMFRLERRQHRNMVAVVSCSDSLWTST